MKPPTLTAYRGRLPHWRMDGSTYFVTWRLAPSQEALTALERTLVVDALKYFEGTRYSWIAYVVMDDHAHVVVTPTEGVSLQQIVHTWKSFTTNRLQRDFGKMGTVWQREFFDRIIRGERELIQKVNYILGNPLKRWPDIGEYEWVECLP
jgi:putative transposase